MFSITGGSTLSKALGPRKPVGYKKSKRKKLKMHLQAGGGNQCHGKKFEGRNVSALKNEKEYKKTIRKNALSYLSGLTTCQKKTGVD